MQKIKAVIFDMDGLMFDTERLWLNSVKTTNKLHNTKVPISLIKECIGLRKDDIDKKQKEYMGQDFDTVKFRELNRKYMQQEIQEKGLKTKPGLIKLVKFLKKNNIPMAIASSSLMPKVERRFTESNFSKDYFSVIVSGDMVEKSKPNPDIYLLACKMLGFKPKDCIALEDSENGLLSAINAGCKTICIPDIKMPSQQVISKCFKVFKTLSQVIDIFK